jgi:hypothetical protein
MKDKHKTKVKFLIHPDSEREGVRPIFANDVFAYFLDDNYYSEGNIGYGGVTAQNWDKTKVCYQHVGQHSACVVEYANECREATPEEFGVLKSELEYLGYNLLTLNS